MLLLATTLHAEERIYGHDMLALQSPNFTMKNSYKYFKGKNLALGTADNTFGTNIEPIRNALKLATFTAYRVHMLNGVCVTRQNCGVYETLYGYTLQSLEAAILIKDAKILTPLSTRTKVYCELKKEFPTVKFYISPIAEHRLGIAAYRILADTVLEACPDITLVNNAYDGNGERYKGALRESHDGFTAPRALVSFDGTDATDVDIDKWKESTKNSDISFIWSRLYTCQGGGTYVDPRKRTLCPKERDFELLSHIVDVRPPAPRPRFTCKFQAFKAPSIWKPLAEAYEGSLDIRGNLPVAIVPLAKRDVSIVGIKGISIGNLRYYGIYQGKLNRYYSGTGLKLSGYQIEKALSAQNGSPWGYLKQGNRCIGPFIAGKRQGLYR